MTAPWQTIPQLVDDAAKRFPNVEAMVDGNVSWTFPEFAEQIHVAGRAFIASGVEPGDTIAVWAPNIWEFAVAALGAHYAGAVLVPVNTRWKGAEAAHVINASRAKMLFTVTDFLDTNYIDLLAEADPIPTVRGTVIMRGDVPEGCASFGDFMRCAEHVTDGAIATRAAAVAGDDLCHIMFTSGTTGLPKGAMLEHSAICRAYESWATVIGLREGDRYLIINPFFHSFGMNAGILACLMKGVTMLPHPVFDVPQVMLRVPKDRISVLPGPPAIYQTILNHPDLDSFDMSTLRLSVTGAAPVPVEMIAEMRTRLGFETIITGYGLTESSGMATMCRHDDPPEIISGTSGRAIDDVEVLIVDDDNNEVPRGEPGEIVIRGYNVMRGYLDAPEQTAEAIDADGWLHSGDIGVMDDAGNVDITDRKKDMFINGGFNCYPAEIENLMNEHPDIAQVAVVGVPDERLGEVGWAYVIATAGTSPSPDDLSMWCREHMANYKAPRRIEVVTELPMNASGKVLKFELRDRAVKQLG